LSSIDKRLARYVSDHYKPVVLGANKWDLVADFQREPFVDYLRSELSGLAFAPVRFLSALRGDGVDGLLATAEELFEESRRRVSTGELNRALARASDARGPSSEGSRVRILYATQAESAPPTFVVFVNDKKLVGKHHIRYLQNRLREELGFGRVPVRIVLRDRGSSENEGHR
ncbi:MAG TPA: hypothetical protein VMS76_12710, partial [Planctomycetota bacterium]|nr:hypothetical protein [Planctomycetota bacterium]